MSWRTIDTDIGGEKFVEFLDRCSAHPLIQQYKRRSFQLLGVQPGDLVLDCGCGTGDDVRSIAALVTKGGTVLGVDCSATMIETAKKRQNRSFANANYRVDDIYNLQLADCSFDRCRVDRVLQHLEHPLDAVLETKRILKPQGTLFLSDPDWYTLIIDSKHRKETAIVSNAVRDLIPNSDMGRRLTALAISAGMQIELVEQYTVVLRSLHEAQQMLMLGLALQNALSTGTLGEEEGSHWLADLKERDRQHSFFAAVTGFAVVARKLS